MLPSGGWTDIRLADHLAVVARSLDGAHAALVALDSLVDRHLVLLIGRAASGRRWMPRLLLLGAFVACNVPNSP